MTITTLDGFNEEGPAPAWHPTPVEYPMLLSAAYIFQDHWYEPRNYDAACQALECLALTDDYTREDFDTVEGWLRVLQPAARRVAVVGDPLYEEGGGNPNTDATSMVYGLSGLPEVHVPRLIDKFLDAFADAL
jgi:hypothetical protein